METTERRGIFVRDLRLEQNVRDFRAQFKEHVSQVFVGSDELIEAVLMALLAQSNILLMSTPGKGKSTLARTISQLLSLTWSFYQFRADTQPSELLGFVDFQRRDKEGKPHVTFGPIFSEIFVADELNRAPSKVKSPLLAAMQEKTAMIVGEYEPRTLSRPRFIIATQNPIESSRSVFELGAAEIDRFGLQLELEIQSVDNRTTIISRNAESNINSLRAIIAREELLSMIEYVSAMSSMSSSPELRLKEHPLIDYIARLSHKTQFVSDPNGSAEGASERAQRELWVLMNAYRVTRGIDVLTPLHVQEMVRRAWRHRIVAPDKKTASRILEASIAHVSPLPETDHGRKSTAPI